MHLAQKLKLRKKDLPICQQSSTGHNRAHTISADRGRRGVGVDSPEGLRCEIRHSQAPRQGRIPQCVQIFVHATLGIPACAKSGVL